MAQWGSYWLCKHKDPSLESHTKRRCGPITPVLGADTGAARGSLACKGSLGGELPVQGDSLLQNIRGRVIVEDI